MDEVRNLVVQAASAPNPDERAKAFGLLVERFQDMACGYAYSILGDFHLAEDAAQAAFVTALAQLADLRRPEAFPGWFRRIVWSECLRISRRNHVPIVSLDAAGEARSAEEGPADILDRTETRGALAKAVAQLPPAQREAATLFYINQYSQRDVADFLEIPVTTVKHRLRESRLRLKERMLAMVNDKIGELKAALRAYGVEADSIKPMSGWSCYVETFQVICDRDVYVARVRDIRATPADVLFAARWGRTVKAEVPVPVGLLPKGDVPRVQGRCVDVCPYIDYEDTAGGEVPPEAWVKIGYWLGCLHRLALPLSDEAPVDLPYGNYPSAGLVSHYLTLARAQVPPQYWAELTEGEALLARTQAFLAPRRPGLLQGVVHGDMHFWNVLYARHQPVAIVDLDFLQRGYLVADLAFAAGWLRAWERDRGQAWHNILDRYISAYEEGRRQPLSDVERACLPWERVLSGLFFFLQNIVSSTHDEPKWREDLDGARELAQSLD